MKKFINLIFCLLLSLSSFNVQASATDVYIDHTKVSFNVASGYPFVENGRTLVPLRATMEAFGATVDWDSATNTAIVKKDTTTVRCTIGDNRITRNNVIIYNDAAAVISDGRTYLPIRAVLEAFGATVTWDGSVKVSGSTSLIHEIETTPSVTSNYWKTWENALNQKNNGSYQETIDTIKSISCVFLNENQSESNAMLFKHLGECYSNLGQYDNASACFKRESYYWNLANMRESCIDAERRSKLIATNSQIYVKTTSLTSGAKKFFGAPNEPTGLTLLGAYAEGDTAIYNAYDPSRFYMDTFPSLVSRDMSAYLLYLPYGTDISHYSTHIEEAKRRNKVMQIALEPHYGLSSVTDANGYITNLARNMQATGCKFLLRFACEVNDTTCAWHTKDYNLYIEKFRLVSSIFKREAPNVGIIWGVNHYPEDTIPNYYPGDEYVDYVGLSSYKMHQPITDPLQLGVDRSRWSNQLDTLYSLYGHKKPIVIVESGASYMDYDTYADITPFASQQINDYYTYLPIKYPNVKYAFIFDSDRDRQKFSLSNNTSYLSAYKSAITSPLYGNSIYDTDNSHYYEIGNNVPVAAEHTTLCSYITTPKNDIAYVNYYLNDIYLGTAYGIPYECNVNFAGYSGQNVKITTKSYNAQNQQLTDYSVNIKMN